MKGELQRWKYGEGRIDRRRRDEKERKTECEAAVYLPNKLDRISSIIKEEREMGKTRRHRRTRTHKKHLSVSGLTTRSHHHHRRHTHTPICTCAALCFLEFLSFFFFTAVCEYTCVWVCVFKNSESEDKQRLVSDSPQHAPPTHPPPHPPTTQFGFSAVSTFHQRGFNVVPSI